MQYRTVPCDGGLKKQSKIQRVQKPARRMCCNNHILVQLLELPLHHGHPGLPHAPPHVLHRRLHPGGLGVDELAEVRRLVTPGLGI